VARREDGPRVDLQRYESLVQAFAREDRRADLRALLGTDELVERFLAVALASISKDSRLLINADPISLIQAIRDSAVLGLEPTGLTGEAWIVCYGHTATLMPGWRGYMKRIRNSNKVVDIDCQVVYTLDDFDYGWTEKGGWYHHHPAKITRDADKNIIVERGDYWGAYAAAVMPSGYVELEVMPIGDLEYVRDHYSMSYKQDPASSPWAQRPSEMMRKTVIRLLAKRLPQAAVEQLLLADARIDQLEAEQSNGAVKLDVSRPRRAALTALAHARGQDVAEETTTTEEVVEQAVEIEPTAAQTGVWDSEPPLPEQP
jgi:recombination protein RecT